MTVSSVSGAMVESFFPIEKLLEKLGSFAYEELLLFCGVKNDLEKLKETLTAVKSVVLDAEEKQVHSHQLRDWLEKLKDACYDAEDALDEFEVEDLRRQVMKQRSIGRKLRNFFGSSNPIAFRFRMGHQIKKIRERFDEIANMMGKFNLTLRLDDHRRVVHEEREPTHSFVRPSDIIGRDGDGEKIIELLMQTSDGESETVSVIPIVGIGGLGKTALAKLVYNDQRVEKHFELKIWICVSEDFGKRQIMTKIINSVTGGNHGNLDPDRLQKVLRDSLNGKRYLLVMDDVWNEDPRAWDELKSLLLGGAEGSKILVTTRSNKVALIMATMRGTTGYNLQELPYKDCLSLFMKCAFKEGQEKHPNLVKIGEKIVEKCRGIPLAVRTVGSLLYGSTDEHDWEYVRDNDIWKLRQAPDDILPALRLSYDQLPPHLKQCFAYCSIFPKDYEFASVHLVQLWMAHGLLQSPNENEELENIGMRYFKELCSRSFFQDLGDLLPGVEVFNFQIHDLMHDLALLVAKGECLTVNSAGQSIPKSVRHLSFVGANALRNDFASFLPDLGRVRTILFPIDDERTSQSFVTSCISKSKSLRVLVLTNSAIEVLPRKMGNLKQLRHLDLSGNRKIKKLPNSICELQSLQTLNLGDCLELEELPKDIRYLVSLRMFVVTTKQKSLLESGIGCLSSLRFLMISNCRNLEYLFEDIDQLSVLRSLVINACPRLNLLPPAMKYLSSLERLIFDECESLSLSLNMEMKEEGSHHDRKNVGSHLRTLYVARLTSLLELPQWLLQGSSKTLQTLAIGDCPNFMALPRSLKDLEALENLVIGICPKLSSLPEGMHHLTTLKTLAIEECPALCERCKPLTGEDWPKIAHIPQIVFDGEMIKSSDN